MLVLVEPELFGMGGAELGGVGALRLLTMGTLAGQLVAGLG